MKWLSQYVARSYKFLIYIYASTLVLVGLSIVEDGSSVSFSTIFFTFILLVILTMFWNLFDTKAEKQPITKANPGVLSKINTLEHKKDINYDSNESIPNPLDSDIEIPLM
tara:strand:+ start:305 stop:634 length:330 start_codon:yes stop_codon:yes gene_type:complete